MQKDVDVGIKDMNGRPVIIPGYCLDTQCKSKNGYKTDALTASCQLNLQVCSNEVNIASKGNVNIGSFVQSIDCTQTVNNNNNNNNNSSGSGSGSGNANTNGSSNTTSSSNTPYIIMIGALLIVIIVIGIVIKAKSSGTSEKKKQEHMKT